MQEHKSALAEQQLSPQILFLFAAIAPTPVSGKPAPVSLAVQTMALFKGRLQLKGSITQQLLQLCLPQPFQFANVGKECARETSVCITQGSRVAGPDGFPLEQSTKNLFTFPTKGPN